MEAEPYRVLVVDDDPAMLDVLRMRLQVWGYEVLLAEDALTGARLAAQEAPDVILTDVWLPDASGVDLLRALTKADPRIPIILISAHGSVDLAVESMKQGAVDYLTKPLDYRRLKELLTTACSRSDTEPRGE
ncbi:MAG: response regulator [Gemmatimonadota bacterium]